MPTIATDDENANGEHAQRPCWLSPSFTTHWRCGTGRTCVAHFDWVSGMGDNNPSDD
ncbi:hypothetical protein GPL21_34855 [Bradyrhizobium pachyrhizi]|uniref:Uncharacterized protein n=1 Tax=Bradyrhizobium pachyrhizi TaxID=280333 RepID=A0A844T1K6_9BRAD|nr:MULTISPECIES: hypothetical protein [Bradyrhizobium]MVT70259.1 hypothetical protein [Bradyrhizobium pachyrhizi]